MERHHTNEKFSFMHVIALSENRIILIEIADGYIYAKISTLWVLDELVNYI